MIHVVKQEKPYFLERINPKDLKQVLCVKPKMDNPRLIRQDGAFLLFGMGKSKLKDECAEVSEQWMFCPHDQRLIVNNSKKSDLLNQLSTFGISGAKLFPEIDKVAHYLKRDFGFSEETFQSSERKQTAGPRVSR